MNINEALKDKNQLKNIEIVKFNQKKLKKSNFLTKIQSIMKKMNKKHGLTFVMSAGSKSVESNGSNSPFKRYIGYAKCTCNTVCPTKEELEKILGREYNKDLNYKRVGSAGEKVIALMFPIEVDVNEEQPIHVLHWIMLRDAPRYNSTNTKVQVVDEYGNFCWMTVEDAKAHKQPMYSNGPAKCSMNYRCAYVGEEQLTKFMIARMNITNPWKYDNGQWFLPEDKKDEGFARFDHIKDFFDGNISELKETLNSNPGNQFKVNLALSSFEGKIYQDIFHQNGDGYLKLNSYPKRTIDADIADYKEKHPDYIVENCSIKEYVIESSNIDTPKTTEAPKSEVKIDDDELPF